jgi:hypothetical protein
LNDETMTEMIVEQVEMVVGQRLIRMK